MAYKKRKLYRRRKFRFRSKRRFFRRRIYRRRAFSRRLRRGLSITRAVFYRTYNNAAPPINGINTFSATESYFRLSDITANNGIGKFTQLFKQFRVRKIVTTFTRATADPPLWDDVANDQQTMQYWEFWQAPDPTGRGDSTFGFGLPDNLDEARQWSGFKTVPMMRKTKKFIIKPMMLKQIYGTTSTTSYQATKAQWLDIADIDTNLYGFIWGFAWRGDANAGGAAPPAYANNAPHVHTVTSKFYVQFRGRYQD